MTLDLIQRHAALLGALPVAWKDGIGDVGVG
jgi:hypothetical protein